MTKTLEGTWEEIVMHAPELTGKRVQVRVLETNRGEEPPEGKTLAQRFAGRIGLVEGGPTDVSERAEEYFAQIMDEKYPPQKLYNPL